MTQPAAAMRGWVGRGRTLSIAAKLGAVLGAMTIVTALLATVLLVQLRQVTTTYDTLLTTEVRSALQAREMQVAFKKQVQEWKNILLRGVDPQDLATYTRQFRDESARVEELGAALRATATDPVVRTDIETFTTAHAELNRNYDAALAAFVAAGAQDPRVPDLAVRGQDRPPTDVLEGVVARLEATVADRVAAQGAGVATQHRVLVVVGLIALLLAVAMLGLVIAGIVRPIRSLTRTAYDAAHRTLPETVGEIRRSSFASPPAVPAIDVGAANELRELASALGSMQASAVQLAFDQHRAERESADVLVNLGRRNQNLLKRTLGYISELEADETDPEVLSRLFRLDHATTRIRRNAESMLVLAGAEQTRTWSQPVPIAEAARAALSEIEDYQRVDLHHLDEAAVTGVAVADLVHLIAELAENATHFSPPGSRVTVVGQHVADGYRIQVSDRGVGMSASELDGANARIARAAEGRSDSPLLGLYVVGRLAARRGITVALEPSAGSGITASVTLPPSMLVDTASLTRTPAETPALPSPAAGPWPVVPNASVPHRGRPAAAGSAVASRGPDGVLPPGWFEAALQSAASEGEAPYGGSIPRRVRGAQLPDLGGGRGQGFAPPDPEQVRRQLAALHRGTERAHAEQAGAAADARPAPAGELDFQRGH